MPPAPQRAVAPRASLARGEEGGLGPPVLKGRGFEADDSELLPCFRFGGPSPQPVPSFAQASVRRGRPHSARRRLVLVPLGPELAAGPGPRLLEHCSLFLQAFFPGLKVDCLRKPLRVGSHYLDSPVPLADLPAKDVDGVRCVLGAAVERLLQKIASRFGDQCLTLGLTLAPIAGEAGGLCSVAPDACSEWHAGQVAWLRACRGALLRACLLQLGLACGPHCACGGPEPVDLCGMCLRKLVFLLREVQPPSLAVLDQRYARLHACLVQLTWEEEHRGALAGQATVAEGRKGVLAFHQDGVRPLDPGLLQDLAWLTERRLALGVAQEP